VSEHVRRVAWAKEDPFGAEFAEARIESDRMRANGIAIGVDPSPYRLDYELETEGEFVTSRLLVTATEEGAERRLDLRRSPDGEWTADRGLPDLADVLDCDLGLSPLTNTMPVLRHRLLEGGEPVELSMAWVSVPDLGVHRSRQRYVPVADGIVRFESLDGSFSAEIVFDSDGLVRDYPGIARRLSGPSGG
jgi:uncharacterized protein